MRRSRRLRVGMGLGLLLAALLPLSSVIAQRPEPKVYGEFEGDPMYTVLPAGAIPAIEEPTFVQGDEAKAQMAASEPVIGVVVDGDARAYSTWQLDGHEIVNDVVGGVALAATW